MKRELERISGAGLVDVDSPRAKRRKETAQAVMPATTSKSNNVASDSSAIKFKQDAFSLWSTAKDATNKEGRLLSTEFLRLPSKRQYADYYQQIQNPIALDEIKSRIETGKYSDLDAVRQDLELCFKNAKKYNMKDSPIWKDAKHLHKLVNKEYARLTGDSSEEAKAADAENDGDAVSGDEGGKKKKAPNLSRILKSRLQKLVDKADDDGRVISAEFMELPSKKMWPGYYKVIKKPQCFENIFKKLKRKEYHTSAEFSKDVQLVFSNAMEFNSEESQIHEDAQTLKSYFHQLMSDVPAPYSLPEYSPSTGTSKITLRLPGTGAASTSSTNVTASAPVKGGSVMLRVPGLPKDTGAGTTTKVAEPETPTPAPSATTRSRAAKEEAATTERTLVQPTPSTSKTTTSTTATTAATQSARTIPTATTGITSVQTTTQPVTTVPVQTYSTHYPNAPYQQPMDSNRPTSTTPSTTQHATSTTSYTPATILPTYPAYTSTGYTPSTTTPLNPLSNLNNYGYAYGGTGYGAGATGTTPYPATNGISYTNATYVNSTATTPSTPAPYYATTSTTATNNAQNANPNANAKVNVVTAPAVTKTPVPVPLRTFKTVLLTTRTCERRLELDAREGVKVWSMRLLNKEKGLRISGVKFDVPPRPTVNSTCKVETAGGQEEEEEGDVKMNEDKDPEEEHEDDGDFEAEPSPTKRGVKGKRKGKGRGKVGRPKKVKVAPPPPIIVTPTTTTVPSVNAVLGEEDVTVKMNNTVVPLCSPTSTSTEVEDGSDAEEDGDGEAITNGKENKNERRWEWDVDIPLGSSVLEISEKGGAVWKVYVDRNFLLDGP